MLRTPTHGPIRPGISRRATAGGTDIIQELLTELAFFLIPQGMTPKSFGDLARYAFVHAAASMSRFRNGKVNQSRVAVLTGLSRADVKKFLTRNPQTASEARSNQTRIERVITGWRTDRRFADKKGQPKRLPFAGSPVSFAGLVRKYAGDVPHRAVLDELRRIRAVRRVGYNIELRASRASRQRHDFARLSFVMPALVDGIRLASQGDGRANSSSIHRLTLPAQTDVDLAVMRDRCISSVRSVLAGLAESLGTQVTVPRKNKRSSQSLTLTVLLVENGIAATMGDATGFNFRPQKSPSKTMRALAINTRSSR